jgi:hypothetical protein
MLMRVMSPSVLPLSDLLDRGRRPRHGEAPEPTRTQPPS